MPEQEIKDAKDFAKQAESFSYVQKNILKIKVVDYPNYDIRFIDSEAHGRIIGMLEYEGKYYVAIFDPLTFTVYVNIVITMEGGRVVETDAITDMNICDLVIAKFDDINAFSNLALISNAVDALIDEYCHVHNMNDDDKKKFRNESISYAVLREAIELAKNDLISVDDLKSVIFSGQNIDERVYLLQSLVQTRKVSITSGKPNA